MIAEEKRLLAGGVEAVAAIAADFRNGIERLAIFDRDAFGGFEQAGERTDEMGRGDLADPAILGGFDADGDPGMLLHL